MYSVAYSAKSLTDLKQLPKKIQTRILDKMDLFAKQSDPTHFAKSLTGRTELRFRIGEYRTIVVLDRAKQEIWVLRVGKRDKVYGLKI